jgi:hypothetical protein
MLYTGTGIEEKPTYIQSRTEARLRTRHVASANKKTATTAEAPEAAVEADWMPPGQGS